MSYLEENRREIFKKYQKEDLIKDVLSFKNGVGNLNKVLNHFFEEIIWESCGKKTKISPMDALKDDVLVDKILKYIESKPNFFTSNEISNVKSYMRNSASWVRKVANFPPKEARDIYNRYNLDGQVINCLDTSMGFGSRMSAVLLSGNNYCGFDPNKKLFKKLKDYKDFLFDNELVSDDLRCGMYCEGSEVFKKELVNLFDVSFTSPPYFNLESYSDDNNASTKNYNNYDLWVKDFVTPTVKNTIDYLKVGGYAMINIKNINKKETCYDDFFKLFSEDKRMQFVEVFDMNIKSKKQYGLKYNNEKGEITPKEPVMVFRKTYE